MSGNFSLLPRAGMQTLGWDGMDVGIERKSCVLPKEISCLVVVLRFCCMGRWLVVCVVLHVVCANVFRVFWSGWFVLGVVCFGWWFGVVMGEVYVGFWLSGIVLLRYVM